MHQMPIALRVIGMPFFAGYSDRELHSGPLMSKLPYWAVPSPTAPIDPRSSRSLDSSLSTTNFLDSLSPAVESLSHLSLQSNSLSPSYKLSYSLRPVGTDFDASSYRTSRQAVVGGFIKFLLKGAEIFPRFFTSFFYFSC